jgi:hypothetical protein
MWFAVMALAGVVALAAGCSTEQTIRTTTQTSASPAAGEPEGYPASRPAPALTTTTTTTTEPDSVLGAAFHLVGTIILLPFRVIGLIV